MGDQAAGVSVTEVVEPASAGLKGQHLSRLTFALNNCPNALRGLTKRVVVKLRIAHRGGRLGMPEQLADDG